MRSILALSVFAIVTVAAHARTPLLPVDEASKDPSFAAFRTELQEIVENKDHKALLERVSENIEFSFGEDAGKENFIRAWELSDEKAAGSMLWAELDKVLSLGGAFMANGHFEAPYVSSSWPAELDAFDHVAVIGSRVRVRAQPNANSEILYVASYEILKAEYANDPWIKVVTPDGQTGYMWSKYLRWPLDYRAHFTKVDGRWLMNVFIAGD
ncbi:MAG: SH3 domain-containing protein [Bdellovibrionales bacterium]